MPFALSIGSAALADRPGSNQRIHRGFDVHSLKLPFRPLGVSLVVPMQEIYDGIALRGCAVIAWREVHDNAALRRISQ